MNNRTLYVLIAVAIIIVGGIVWNSYRTAPVVQITTDAAKVSIGQGGVSISVAPSSQQ